MTSEFPNSAGRHVAAGVALAILAGSIPASIIAQDSDEWIRLHYIDLFSRPTADYVLARLNDGSDFSDLAFVYGALNAHPDGDRGEFAVRELPVAVRRAIRDLEPGEWTRSPVRTGNVYTVFRVTLPGYSEPFSFTSSDPREALLELLGGPFADHVTLAISKESMPSWNAASGPCWIATSSCRSLNAASSLDSAPFEEGV